MNYIDKDGKFAFLIPVLGALIGGAVNAISNYDAMMCGQMSGWEYAGSIIFGAGVGALASMVGGGLWGAVAAGGIGAGANDLHNQALKADQIDYGRTAVSVGLGGVVGGFGYGASKLGSKIITGWKSNAWILNGMKYVNNGAQPIYHDASIPAGALGSSLGEWFASRF